MPGRSSWFFIALLYLLALLAPHSAQAQAAEARESGAAPAIRTLAIAEPVVLGPDPGDAWLGGAVAELLKAKLQFLKKVRLVERERLEPYLARLRDAGREPDGKGEANDRVALLVPAEAFCVGSIEVDGRGRQPRLAVRLRLVQTATGMVLSRLTATATGDLPGLLSLAEQLAKEMAAALGETLDAGALAYREPERLDALKLHAEGLQQLARGEHRAAVAALTAALDGNGGVYFPAAHRDLGLAYRLWAQSLAGAEADGVRQAYLTRFKEDALIAATAIFDLGVAYQENGLHREAIETFTDYVTAVGEEGERVRWSFTKDQVLDAVARLPGAPTPSNRGRIDWAGIEGDILHLLVGEIWIRLDARTGVPVAAIPITRPLGGTTIRVSEGRLIFSDYDEIAVLSPEGDLAWKSKVGGNLDEGRTDAVEQDMIIRRSHQSVGIYSLEDGSLIAKIPEKHESPLFGLDPAGSRFIGSEGSWSLPGGALIAASGLAIKGRLYDWLDLPLPGIRHATGTPGFEWALAHDATPERPVTVLLRDGAVTQALGVGCFPAGEAWLSSLPGGRYLLFSCGEETPHGKLRGNNSHYLLVDTTDGRTRTLFKGVGTLPALISKDKDHLVFSFRMDYPREDPVLRGEQGLVPDDLTGAFTVVETATGKVIARERTVRQVPLHAAVLDGELVLASGQRIARLRLPRQRGPVLIPVGEAQLRIAGSLLERGDLTAAQRSIEAFAAETPGDPRERLALMRLEVARARAPEASYHARAALISPLLDDREIRACLDVLRRTNPEYRDFIRLPAGVGRLRLRGMTDDGVIVAQGGDVWHLIDSGRKTVRSAASPFKKSGVLRLDQGEPALFRFVTLSTKKEGSRSNPRTAPWRFERFDLASRTLVEGGAVPEQTLAANESQYIRPLEGAGIPPGVIILNSRSVRATGETGRIRADRRALLSHDSVLVVMDPQTLAERHRVTLAPRTERPIALSRNLAVLGKPFLFAASGDAPQILTLVRRSDGLMVAQVEIPLLDELIFATATDEKTLFVGVVGGDNDTFIAGTDEPWFRIEAFPVGPEGVRWSYRSDGYLASNPIVENGHVSFAAVPGPLPRPKLTEDATLFDGFATPLKLLLLRLDAHSGALVGTKPLPVTSKSLYGKDLHPLADLPLDDPAYLLLARGGIGRNTDPISPRILFSGSEESVWGDPAAVLEYLFHPAGSRPLELEPGSLERKIYLDIKGRCIVRDGTVYEAFGQGLVLVKEYGDGAWMDSFAPE